MVPLNPYLSACSTSLSAPSCSPISPKTTLHETVSACSSVIVGAPPRQCSPPKFCSVLFVCGRSRTGGLGNRVSGVMPFSSAADAVMSLNVEPGGDRSCAAREISGLPGRVQQPLPGPRLDLRGRATRAASGRTTGLLTIASTSPVRGFIATTAPGRVPSACGAVCWSFGSMVVITVAPRFGRPSSSSTNVSGVSCEAVPASQSFWLASSALRP